MSSSDNGSSLSEPRGEAELYRDASVDRPKEWFDWESLNLAWSEPEPYHVITKLGRGHFGEVFSAIDVRKEAALRKKFASAAGSAAGSGPSVSDKVESGRSAKGKGVDDDDENESAASTEKAGAGGAETLSLPAEAEAELLTKSTVVIKVLKPVQLSIIKREIKFLTNLRRGTNIIKLLDLVENPLTAQKSLIFEYVDTPDFKKMYAGFSDHEVRFYMYQLLLALDYTHSKGVIHRDIKPHNVLIDPVRKTLRLIDWGLAAFYNPGQRFRKFPGTRVFKAPEMLMQYSRYDYAVDMWSFGAMMAGIVFKKHPVFKGRKENINVLVAIVKLMGSDGLFDFVDKYGVRLRDEWDEKLEGYEGSTWDSLVTRKNKSLAVADAIDLLSGILVYDHEHRLNCEDHARLAGTVAHRRGIPPEGTNSGSSDEDFMAISDGGAHNSVPAGATPLTGTSRNGSDLSSSSDAQLGSSRSPA
ncbi:CMGC/CK2 protein kinase [Thecamonas trahens ATCC 50062]|uniref:non-specific serine/threonine protein kinase n=1 Tax=Thecamonas trahens ATCC 50062 TaxID=461836 RepID=A0A0L0DFQ8_THETB|nr:CMGC/CK2 protein kinase [Thecamonas trahens ATCC 50062]KNC51001.1 CMGC/CK2 protein kinase [Thecamonas trahens ATCC 50062]|eukprot:XP_013756470.1 CMGC/CK2 protein kinase [Thecamonas trahens ATCC 50062]